MVDSASKDVERAAKILRHVLDRTRNGSLSWMKRESRDFAYEADLPSGNVEVGTVDNDGAAPWDFRIYGAPPFGGLKITIDTVFGEHWAEDIEQLWKIVNRADSGIDETLDGLLRDLGAE